MEKFAVDLEKVLDEFEYNEEREENVSVASTRNPSLPALGIGSLRQIPVLRPPAASYRRPSFEPINLAEADFAASPPKPSSLNFNIGASVPGKQNADETFGFVGNKVQINNSRNYVNTDKQIVSTLNNESNFKNQLLLESEDETSEAWHEPQSSVSIEEKPDLLEYNSKNVDFSTNKLDIHNQLPDLTTSVRSLDHESINNVEENVPSSLDLISSTSGHLVNENEEIIQTRNTCESDEPESIGTGENLVSNNRSQFIPHSDQTWNASEEEKNKISANLDCNGSQNISYEHPTSLLNSNNVEIVKKVCEKTELNDSVQPYCKVINNAPVPPYDIQCVTTKEIITREELSADHEESTYPVSLQSVQPIGFTNDSDVSEGELEEYLKELEEMDQTFDFKEEIQPEENFKINITKSAEESNKVPVKDYVPFKTGSDSYSDSINTSTLNDSVNVGKGDEFVNSNAHSEVSSSEHVIDEKVLESSKSTYVKFEPPMYKSEDFDTSTSSSPQISENESTSEESDKAQNKAINIDKTNGTEIKLERCGVEVENTYVKASVSKDNCGEKSSNPFCNTNFIEHTDASKRVGSTNPFEDEDSGYVSEKMESQRRSTNPFEDDDTKDISIDCSVSETPSPAKKEILNENLTLTVSKSKSKKSNKNRLKKENLKNDDVASSTVISHSEKSLSSDKIEAISVETVHPTLLDNVSAANTTEALAAFEDDSANASLPSCSTDSGIQKNFTKTLDSSTKMIPIKAAVESPSAENVDEAGVAAEEERPPRPNSLELSKKITVDASVPQSPPLQSPPLSPPITGQLAREFGAEDRRLGKIPPFWVPDTDAISCMQCQQKFTVIKRRHHCRACGQVLCYKCCSLKSRLEYMNFTEARVCQPCFTILEALNASEASSPLGRQPNPNNPMEYCSTIPPLQQAAGSLHQPPPSVMVPVGVLKREGRSKSEVTKQVMFSDGIRPGGDLTELDGSCEPRLPFRRPGRLTKRVGTPPGGVVSPSMRRVLDPVTHSFIPAEGDSSLPPLVSRVQGEITFSDLETPIALNQPNVKFAINRNLFVVVRRVMLDCCVNRECWCFSTEGLACVGQDEIVFLLECLPQESQPPKDIFLLINYLYQEAAKGSTVSEMSFTPATSNNLLGSKDHGGFLYIRTSYQCLTQLVLPSPPYLVALLIHRWETPWARLFPLRLVLRLGAEFRYYPCPLVSVRNRPPLYTDIGHTIINILADFRKYSYTLPSVRGLVIHMEDRQTTINIPRNRYDQVVRALNNSNDSVLAFGANLSLAADSHLVCMQSTEDENTAYTTQAINIHNKPRKVTGASFVVFNGALKVPGLAGKSNIVEDGLMVQVPSETMTALRTALRDMRDYTIGCGPNAEETVALQWTADDTNFNIGVKSCIDSRALDGVPSIRVHNGTDYSGGTRIIRWTEVFILQCDDSEHSSEPLDISRLSESIARATCLALVPLLDLLSAASFSTLAVRTTIHPDNVGYEAGSNGEKLPPLYMKSLDDELIAVVHQAALASQDNPCVLELVFRIMEQG